MNKLENPEWLIAVGKAVRSILLGIAAVITALNVTPVAEKISQAVANAKSSSVSSCTVVAGQALAATISDAAKSGAIAESVAKQIPNSEGISPGDVKRRVESQKTEEERKQILRQLFPNLPVEYRNWE